MATATRPVVLEMKTTTALELRKRVENLDQRIKAHAKIMTPQQYEIVGAIGIEANGVIKEATAFYKPEVEKLYSLWKDKTGERASIVDPAQTIKDLAGRLTAEWQREQERLRLEEQRRLEEEERKRAEAEALEEAVALEREGRHEEAEMLIEAPVYVAPVVVNSAVPKLYGVSKPRDNFQAEIFDLRALAKGVVEGKVPIDAIQGNEQFLNAMARARKGTLDYPGVRVVNRPKSAFKS